MDNLKDMKDEVLVMTNASDGNKPHVVERIEQDGSLKTQPLAKAKPDGDFLKIDRSESILEAFFSNFKRQFDNPSDFRFYHIPAELLAAAKDMADLFRKPEENAAMIDGYRLDPEQHVQKQDLRQAPATEEPAPQQSTKWSMEQVDWQQLARMGITPESLGEIGTARLLNGHESAVLDIRTSFEGISFETPACIRLVESPDGKPVLNIECCKRYPDLKEYMGTELPQEVQDNLLKTNNAGRTIDIRQPDGTVESCLLSFNPKTNRLHHLPMQDMKQVREINGVTLTEDQGLRLMNGESVLVEGMWSERRQKHYDARLQYNVCKGGFDYDFRGMNRKVEQGQSQSGQREIIIPQKLKGVELSQEQKDALKAGKAAYVKGMSDGVGGTFNAYVRPNYEKMKFDFFRWNPDKSKKQSQGQTGGQPKQSAQTASQNRRIRKSEKKGVGASL